MSENNENTPEETIVEVPINIRQDIQQENEVNPSPETDNPSPDTEIQVGNASSTFPNVPQGIQAPNSLPIQLLPVGAHHPYMHPMHHSGAVPNIPSHAHPSWISAGIIPLSHPNAPNGYHPTRKIAWRKGKWFEEEEAYTKKLIEIFTLGYLSLTAGTTLRSFLSEKLCCDPMRITKKFAGASCIGKQIYSPCDNKVDGKVIKQAQEDLKELEEKFLAKIEVQNALDCYPLSPMNFTHPHEFYSHPVPHPYPLSSSTTTATNNVPISTSPGNTISSAGPIPIPFEYPTHLYHQYPPLPFNYQQSVMTNAANKNKLQLPLRAGLLGGSSSSLAAGYSGQNLHIPISELYASSSTPSLSGEEESNRHYFAMNGYHPAPPSHTMNMNINGMPMSSVSQSGLIAVPMSLMNFPPNANIPYSTLLPSNAPIQMSNSSSSNSEIIEAQNATALGRTTVEEMPNNNNSDAIKVDNNLKLNNGLINTIQSSTSTTNHNNHSFSHVNNSNAHQFSKMKLGSALPDNYYYYHPNTTGLDLHNLAMHQIKPTTANAAGPTVSSTTKSIAALASISAMANAAYSLSGTSIGNATRQHYPTKVTTSSKNTTATSINNTNNTTSSSAFHLAAANKEDRKKNTHQSAPSSSSLSAAVGETAGIQQKKKKLKTSPSTSISLSLSPLHSPPRSQSHSRSPSDNEESSKEEKDLVEKEREITDPVVPEDLKKQQKDLYASDLLLNFFKSAATDTNSAISGTGSPLNGATTHAITSTTNEAVEVAEKKEKHHQESRRSDEDAVSTTSPTTTGNEVKELDQEEEEIQEEINGGNNHRNSLNINDFKMMVTEEYKEQSQLNPSSSTHNTTTNKKPYKPSSSSTTTSSSSSVTSKKRQATGYPMDGLGNSSNCNYHYNYSSSEESGNDNGNDSGSSTSTGESIKRMKHTLTSTSLHEEREEKSERIMLPCAPSSQHHHQQQQPPQQFHQQESSGNHNNITTTA